jgi:hypothetical protein
MNTVVRIAFLAAVLTLPAASSADILSGAPPAEKPPPPPPTTEPQVVVVRETVVQPVVPAVPVAVPAAPVAVPAVPVAVPVAPVVQRTEVVVNESEVYGPSAEDSSDPKRLLHAFCQAWKDEDWKRVWYCMEPSFRKSHDFAAFQRRFEDDAEMTGGLDDETIAADPKVQGSKQTFEVTLSFQNAPLAKPRKVKATLKTTPDGYRVVESTILPADLNDM